MPMVAQADTQTTPLCECLLAVQTPFLVISPAKPGSKASSTSLKELEKQLEAMRTALNAQRLRNQ